jgi:hypothetical protein
MLYTAVCCCCEQKFTSGVCPEDAYEKSNQHHAKEHESG